MKKINTSFNTFDRANVGKCIEIGHIFFIGDSYSENMQFYFRNEQNEEKPYITGCYGIGVSRLLSAISSIKKFWPKSISPFNIHLIGTDKRIEDFYNNLEKKESILLDDRELSMGQKFEDADLIGIPVRIIIGKNIELIDFENPENNKLFKSEKELNKFIKENYKLNC